MAQPNAGQPVLENMQVTYKQTPDEMVKELPGLLAAGARLVLPSKLGELARVLEVPGLKLLPGAGLTVLDDHRGGTDSFGRELKVTLINRADAIASMATMVMGETTERMPVAVVRGLPLVVGDNGEQPAAVINRPLEEDLFR